MCSVIQVHCCLYTRRFVLYSRLKAQKSLDMPFLFSHIECQATFAAWFSSVATFMFESSTFPYSGFVSLYSGSGWWSGGAVWNM